MKIDVKFLTWILLVIALIFNRVHAFDNIQAAIQKGKYRVSYVCKLKEFEISPMYSDTKKYPGLVNQTVTIVDSNNWFITKLVIGDLQKPNWVSRKLYNQTGVANNDEDNFSFSYSSIGGSYHGLVSVDKKSGNGIYTLKYNSPLHYITGEDLLSSSKMKFTDCKEIPRTKFRK